MPALGAKSPVAQFGQQLYAQAKARTGRPSNYQAFYPALVRRFAEIAVATVYQVAQLLDTSVSQVYKWAQQHPEFAEALKEAKQSVDDRVVHSLAMSAIGYEHDEELVFRERDDKTGKMVTHRETVRKRYKPDNTSQIFFLKNRDPQNWRDQRDLNFGQLPSADKLDTLSDAQVDVLLVRIGRALFGPATTQGKVIEGTASEPGAPAGKPRRA